MNDFNCTCNRRQMARSLVCGSLVLPGIIRQLLADEARDDMLNPLAPKAPHFPGKAKRVIFLFMTGGVSHMDSFDPKPRLLADAGKALDSKNPKSAKYLAPLWEFKR